MKIRFLGADFVLYGRTEGQTDMKI